MFYETYNINLPRGFSPLGVESDYTFIKASHGLVNWTEAKYVCNNNNLTLPTFNESTLLQFVSRNIDFIGTDMWQDGICGWNETTCQRGKQFLCLV